MNDPILLRLKRRLARWELPHLRAHAAELAQRLEETEAKLARAEADAAGYWRQLEWTREQLTAAVEASGTQSLGLTMDGALVVVDKPEVPS